MSHNAYHFALVYLAGYVFQHRIVYLVAEINAVKFNIALNVKVNRVIAITNVSVLVKYLKDLACGN